MSCSWDDKTLPTTGIFAPSFPETATKVWNRKLLDMINEKCLLNAVLPITCASAPNPYPRCRSKPL